MANQTVIKVELQGLQDLSKALDSQQVKEEIAENLKMIVTQYYRRHFINSSEGGGDWKDLSAATERSRRPGAKRDEELKAQTSVKQHMSRQAKILRDTGQLYAALNPNVKNAPGREEILTIENGKITFEFGYGGNATWDYKELPKSRRTKKDGTPRKTPDPITISALACIHHYGVPGRIPARPIVVPLDEATIKKIETKIEEIILQEGS